MDRKRAFNLITYLACMGIILGMLVWAWMLIPPG